MTPTPQPSTRSPFPGMDPYIEAQGWWEDFHAKFIAEIDRALSALLPQGYFSTVASRSYIVLAGVDGKESNSFVPDISVQSGSPEPSKRLTEQPGITATQAITMRAFIETHFRERFIEIIQAGPERQLVTCIEVLSPSNKRVGSKGRRLYLRKRNALMLGSANLVELDLVRSGQRMPMHDAWPDSPYYALICQQNCAPYCRVWPVSYRVPLPAIPIPLDKEDMAILLDLQPLVDAVYTRSRLAERLDYTKALAPPLNADDGTWLQEQLRLRQQQATTEHTTS